MAMYGSQRFHVLAIAVILHVILLRKAPSERKEDQRAGAVGTILLSPFFRWYFPCAPYTCTDFNPRKTPSPSRICSPFHRAESSLLGFWIYFLQRVQSSCLYRKPAANILKSEAFTDSAHLKLLPSLCEAQMPINRIFWRYWYHVNFSTFNRFHFAHKRTKWTGARCKCPWWRYLACMWTCSGELWYFI